MIDGLQKPVEPIAQFFIEAVHMTAKSQQEGRPIYEDVEHVKLLIPGDSKSVVVRKARDEDRERFKEAYARFKASDVEAVEGTPLEQWGRLTPSRVMELKTFHILSVENLAGLSDANIQEIGMGGRELVAEAKAYLESTKDASTAQSLAAENERLKGEVERQEKTISDLAARLEALEKKEAA